METMTTTATRLRVIFEEGDFTSIARIANAHIQFYAECFPTTGFITKNELGYYEMTFDLDRELEFDEIAHLTESIEIDADGVQCNYEKYII